MDDGTQHIDTTRARGGSSPGIARYVLFISLGLVVVAFLLLLILAG
jgi:hypothetical protein